MKLLVGLGNPGDRYARNRHNIGFMALERIAHRHSAGPFRAKFQAQLVEVQLGVERVLLLMPQTYMNESGRSVAQAARFHKIELKDIFVLHDELDLAAGKVRVRLGGGTAGHNGLRSIDACLGSREFRRVRLGIGHPGHKDAVLGHVLGDFSKADHEWLEPLLDALADAAPLLVAGDESTFMNRVASALQPPRPNSPRDPPQAVRPTEER